MACPYLAKWGNICFPSLVQRLETVISVHDSFYAVKFFNFPAKGESSNYSPAAPLSLGHVPFLEEKRFQSF